MIEVNYTVEEDGWKKNFPYFKKCISNTVTQTLNIINNEFPKKISVTFLLTSNKKIKELNFKFRNKNKPTNVLSFPMQLTYLDSFFLGDIALSNQTLIKEAIEQKIAKYDYLCKITIHGMLHLMGYDHKTEKQFKEMEKYEKQIYETIKNKL